jgi:RHS repeat-associated protein
MTVFLRVIAAVVILVVTAGLGAAQDTTPPRDQYEVMWMSPSAGANGEDLFDEAVEPLCKKTRRNGAISFIYNGNYYTKAKLYGPDEYVDATCYSNNSPGGLADNSWPLYHICATVRADGGQKTVLGYTLDWQNCVRPPTQSCLIDNPVDIGGMAKSTIALDWESPIDSRFKIERNYRSDGFNKVRHGVGNNSGHDLFSSTWQRTYGDLLDSYPGNPYDASDTRRLWRYDSGTGKIALFSGANLGPDQSVIPAYGYDFRTISYNGDVDRYGATYRVIDSQGVTRYFYNRYSDPYVLTAIVWPDGYTIWFDREQYVFHTGMHDNKGNIATFVFNQSVVPGANRRLISEVILSRQTPTGPVETGRLAYTYAALEFPSGLTINTSESNLPDVLGPLVPRPEYPAITAVDYRAAGSTTTTPIWRYTYQTSLPTGNREPVIMPMLTSISDGSATPFAEYSYKNYGSDFDGNYLGYGVASSKSGGNIATRSYGRQSTAADQISKHTAVNQLGLETTYEFKKVKYRRVLVGVQGAPAPGCLGTSKSISHDANGEVIERINRNGSRTTYVRDSMGRILTQTEDADGLKPRVTSYTWHPTLRLPLSRTTEGLAETFTYDPAGLLLSYSQADTKPGSPTLNQTRTSTYGYTKLANGLKVMTSLDGPGLSADSINDVTTYTYTTTGDLATATDANGLVTTVLARNTNGQPTLVEQPDLSRWSFTYDFEGRVLTAGFAGSGQTPLLSTFTYDNSGQVLTYKNTRGKIWTFTYDAARRLTETTSPTGDKVTYTYDAAGNVIKEEYRNGTSPVTFWEGAEFDGLSRVLKTLGAMGQTWNYSHDVEDNLAKVTDPLTKTTTNSYDKLNRLISTVDREAFSSGMKYDVQDRMTEYADPRAIKTLFTYNGFGDVLSEVSADRGTITYTYDRRGLVSTRTDARGITMTYAYDNGGRLKLIDYPANTIPDIAFTYDTAFLGVPASSNKGHVGSISDGIIDTQFGHEVTATGPRIKATATYPGARTYTVTEETDFEGNPTRTIYPSGKEVLYTVDNANRITSIKLKNGATTTNLLTSMTYVPMGPLKSALYGDGYTQTRTYDKSYRMTGLKDVKGTTKLRELTYLFEGRDNLTKVTDKITAANTETFTYTFRESLSGATGPYGALAYTYDGVGNRLTAKLGTATDSYSYPATSNRLSMINLATGGTRGFTYDAAGNVITEARPGGTYSYTYNAAGRMAEFRINDVLQATYKYDAMGRQAIRTLTSPTSVTIHSVFDSDGRRIAEYDEATGALIREYVWNGWEAVAVIEGGVISFVRTDHIGRPVFATNSAGVKVWSASYLPFGGVHVSTGSPPNARFPGQWFQSESGLHQNWMRDYDPTTGRYLQADPLGLVAGMNVYGYANQSPMMYLDPNGENPLLIGAAIGFGIGFLFDALSQLYDNGGRLECVNWWQAGLSGVLGGLTGGAGGSFGGAGLKAGLKGLSNSTKGKIGEALTRISNPRLWFNPGTGARLPGGLTSVVDFSYVKSGVLYVVESKFGKSTLTKAQRAAQKALGANYSVQRWSYGFFGNVGGGFGGGAAAGLGFPFFPDLGQRRLCECQGVE